MKSAVSARPAGIFHLAVIVAALGYFVDIYDLLLFSVVKKVSMLAVGSTDTTILADSTRVLNWQMFGLLLGGILWGMLGDKKGRLSVLFGSILLYSVANFATSFVHSVSAYAIARFVAGFGLAGELGAGITLVSELLPQKKRGIGTSLVAGIGLMGAVFAFLTFKVTSDWRLCYQIGGGLGIVLLILRISVAESGMFLQAKQENVSRGNFGRLFTDSTRFRKYLMAILIGLPTWYVIGILVNQSDRFARVMYPGSAVDSGRAIMLAYIGLAVGDVLAGFISQAFQSRKKAMLFYFSVGIIGFLLFFTGFNSSDTRMYSVCALLGFANGYWAIFVTMGAEQFGTNLRATAATTIPNMVRGALPLINWLFLELFQKTLGWSIVHSAIVTGCITMAIAFLALYLTEETYHKDLNYLE